MAVIESGVTTDLLTIDPSKKAGRSALYPPEALGHYRLASSSGLLTLVAAGTATAGHLFVFRAPSANLAVIQKIVMRHWITTAATAALEYWFKFFRLTGFSAAYTGGTDIVLTSPAFQKRTTYPQTTIQQARIATTAGLTAGTQILDTTEFLAGGYSEPATAAAHLKVWSMAYTSNESGEHGLVVTGNEGFIIRNEILGSAAGVARMSVEVDWFEVAAW